MPPLGVGSLAFQAKLMLALVPLVVVGLDGCCENTGVFGRTESTNQLNAAGAEMLSTLSRASTWKLCDPCARPLYEVELVQAVKGALSSEQRKLTPLWLSLKL